MISKTNDSATCPITSAFAAGIRPPCEPLPVLPVAPRVPKADSLRWRTQLVKPMRPDSSGSAEARQMRNAELTHHACLAQARSADSNMPGAYPLTVGPLRTEVSAATLG